MGATEILKEHKAFYYMHLSWEGIKLEHVDRFIDRLMSRNPGEEVWAILGDYRPNRSIAPEHESKCRGKLRLMFLLAYSPEVSTQENVWAWLKDYCAQDSAYTDDKELNRRILQFFVYAYSTPPRMKRRVDARVYLRAA